MRVKMDSYDVGVIIGRFQVPELHEAHKALIQAVCDKHDKVLVFLGLSPLMVTRENPLDFESRKQMILEQFPKVNVLYIKDLPSDKAWSKRLDEMIEDTTTPNQSVVLYGGRDSFIDHYTGKHVCHELEADVYTSGSEVRREVSRRSVKGSSDFRAGVVWAAFSRFPTAYTTVDIAIFSSDKTKILLGRKQFESQYRLIGGFADPSSDSFETDARREVHEEAGIDISDPKYIGSFKIDDWRYRNEADSIKTLLFTAVHVSGAPRPDDDIAEVKWFKIDELDLTRDVLENHRQLVKAAITNDI